MRSDRLYLADILDAIAAIERFTAAHDLEAFLADDLTQSAVLQKLAIIGEAASRLAEDTRAQAVCIPWKEIVGFRNVAVHAYFSVDWRVVHVTLKDDLPPLKAAVTSLLERV
jgi:uncharacterized protein with HEPN domain